MAKRNRNSKKSKRNRRAKRAAQARPTIDIHAKTQAQQSSPLMQALKTTAAVEKPASQPDDQERATKVDVAVERMRLKRESDSRQLREPRPACETTETNEGPGGVEQAAPADDWDEAFFRRGEEIEKEQLESLAPVAEEVEADDDNAQEAWSTSPVVLKRRARFQKLVGIVVAAAAAVVLLGVGTNLSANEPKAAAGRQVTHATVSPQHTSVKASHKVRAVAHAKDEHAQGSSTSSKNIEAAPKEQKAKPLTIKKQTPDKKPIEVAPLTGTDAQKQALALLNRGKMKQVVPVAKQAVAQHPDQALPYLYLGSALQDLGRRREAIDAYSECVRHATHGPVSECRAMGGRK